MSKLRSQSLGSFAWRLVCSVLLTIAPGESTGAQAPGFAGPSLDALRRAAAMVPGAAPTALNVLTLAPGRYRRSDWVDIAAEDSITFGLTVFQIRFPEGWITIDGASDRDLMPSRRTFSDAVYATIQDALRNARLSLVTHEHWDHARGVLHSPHLAEIQRHTMLTRAQVQTLLSAPPDARVAMDSATATKYLIVDYDGYLPVAPGVVLIKAAGHTSGSQMIYVRLASEREVVLAGDVAWNMTGVLEERLKPAQTLRTRNLTEDQVAVAEQLRWLKGMAARGVAVLVSHDIDRIAALASQGVVGTAFDLSRR